MGSARWAFIALPLLKLVLHLATFRGYGMFRDEYYYLACADRLAWGYVDHPPLSLLVLRLVTDLLGDSLFAVRLVPALAGAASVMLVGVLVRQMRGGIRAAILAMACAVLAPTYLALHHFYSMNALDILLWAAAASLWLRALHRQDLRSWLWLGLVLGLGLLNKISMLWLGFGLGVGLLVSPQRRQLLRPGPWMALGVALLLFLPHLVWQIQHDWPTLEFIRNATQNKMVQVDVWAFARAQIDSMNSGSLLVWLPGLVWLLVAPGARTGRSLGVAYLAIFLLLALSGSSRAGYLAPAYVWLYAAGGVAFEHLAPRWKPRWVTGVVAVILVFNGLLAAPFGLPLLSVERYVRYAEALGVGPSTSERKELAELPQFYADMHGWREIVDTVAQVFDTLTPEERQQAAIFVYNYGEAGAIDYHGRPYGLPPALSGHNNYWLWGPRDHTGEVVVIIGNSRDNHLARFEQVEQAAVIDCGRCMPYENGQVVWVCRGLKLDIAELWPHTKHFD